ncbi:unnamed protein product [Phytophthora fragariaefolia]|uniref:Unnamed protein product n=1 Tax=Phytophthora fragariaefolia TaxID=1490495 RepID=A0A9W6XNK3_9STRA|nr:unnamed protein product [Phytophthora fragariaefolia]
MLCLCSIRVELARGGSRRDGGGRRDDDRGGYGGRGGGGGDRFDRGTMAICRTSAACLTPSRRYQLLIGCADVDCDDSIAEFQTKEDMEDAVKKLDDTEFRGSYVRVAPESDSSRRSRSRSPARGRSPSRRSRSRSPAPRKDSPRRSRSRSASPAAALSPARKDSA